ncbi:MAG: chalcone isomerase family protein [Planctomycetes bacterium]|nr:chalcone isomerase family protein [Planctomycetota bacterium]
MRALVLLLCAALAAAVEPPVRGTGRFTYLWFDVYDVELRLAPGVPADPAAQSCRLSFTYLRAFTAAELAKATTRTVRERIGTHDTAEIERGLAAINALWPAVARGDILSLDAIPGAGVRVSVNGRELGQVPGDAFARVLFSIWLGGDPIDVDLRDALMGGA